MPEYEIMPTKENIVESIQVDWLDRSQHIYDFIKLIESLDNFNSISLDGRWGSGKTFFLKQIQLILNSQNEYLKENKKYSDILTSSRSFSAIKIEGTYRCVYYDTWLYDNHVDPILSLLFIIAKDTSIDIDVVNKPSISKKLIALADALTFWKGGNISDLLAGNEPEDLLDCIRTIETIKASVKELFNELLQETADKLVIMVDELDRCRPNYAVEVLENLKHFCDDERIVIIYAVNKLELSKTVSHFYGQEFDASRYLDKFFNLNIKLPQVERDTYLKFINATTRRNLQVSEWYERVVLDMCKYFDFSLRDSCHYVSDIKRIFANSNESQIDNGLSFILVPIAHAVRIVNTQQSALFEEGKNFELLRQIVTHNNNIKVMFEQVIEEDYSESELEKVYNCVFKEGGIYKGRTYDDYFSSLTRSRLGI